MENITITIETSGAAFDETPASEIARILRQLATRFERDGIPAEKLYDVNGNACGRCIVEKGA